MLLKDQKGLNRLLLGNQVHWWYLSWLWEVLSVCCVVVWFGSMRLNLSICSISCLEAAHSSSLLMYAKFETGLKLLSIRSRLALFSSGLTKAILSVSGNMPLSRERFTMSVMSSRTHGSICFRRSVRIGSSSQLLFGVASIIFLTSCRDRLQNLDSGFIFGAASTSAQLGRWEHFSRSTDLILVTLSMKKLLNLSASSWLVHPGGRGDTLVLPRSWLHMV